MRLSTIVPAYNEEKLLPRCLAAIRAAAAPLEARGWTHELVVCDNHSTDATAATARAAGALVVHEPVNQISRARNRGAGAATGDWLVFVDADSFPTPELYADLAEAILGGRCIGGGCTVRMDEPLPSAALLTALWNAISRMRRWAAGSFVFCEARAFRETGGFSTQLYASEEIDFSRRLGILARSRGLRVVILNRHRILTSARKMHLITGREFLAFLLRLCLSGGRSLRSRAACAPWYNGRR